MAVRGELLRGHRLKIREQMIVEGKNPYPQDGHRTHTNVDALNAPEGTEVTVAGRIQAIRSHGRTTFIDLIDQSGILQLVFTQNELGDLSEARAFLDIGDFIRASGSRYLTRTGEPSVMVKNWDMLTKSIRQLPDTLADEETRFRQRSVDLSVNRELVEIFKKRAAITHSVRSTLMNLGFLEVETPALQPLYGGANARPFTTWIHAWDMPLYLRISPELYLKLVMMGGIERVFEICHNFRNEGVDRTHNPEFTMMECYAAYWDYNDMMLLTEQLYLNAAIAANGTGIVSYQGTEINFEKPWERLTMKDGIIRYLGINVDTLSDIELQQAITAHGETYTGKWIRGLGIASLFGAVEKYLIQPTFVTDMPKETTSLCKLHRDDPTLIERFEPYIAGMEIGNAYTELNDPILQRQFWEEERAEEPDAHPLDEDFITAMEYGMPPAGGLGLGIDRMTILLTDQTKLRDVILFPTMKPIRSNTVKE